MRVSLGQIIFEIAVISDAKTTHITYIFYDNLVYIPSVTNLTCITIAENNFYQLLLNDCHFLSRNLCLLVENVKNCIVFLSFFVMILFYIIVKCKCICSAKSERILCELAYGKFSWKLVSRDLLRDR